MKRRSAFLTFAACALMAAQPAKAADEKPAQEQPKAAVAPALPATNFFDVQVVTFNDNNNVGFFNRRNGTLYIYDSSLAKCIAIKKFTTLGAPAETIKQ